MRAALLPRRPALPAVPFVGGGEGGLSEESQGLSQVRQTGWSVGNKGRNYNNDYTVLIMLMGNNYIHGIRANNNRNNVENNDIRKVVIAILLRNTIMVIILVISSFQQSSINLLSGCLWGVLRRGRELAGIHDLLLAGNRYPSGKRG